MSCDSSHIPVGGGSGYHWNREPVGHLVVNRLLICVLVLGLILLGPTPASLCALASSLVSECASPETQTQCDQMDMGTPTSPVLTAHTASCCTMSHPPLPETKSAPSGVASQQEPTSISLLAIEVVNSEHDPFVDIQQDCSPPPLQSLLCIFLI